MPQYRTFFGQAYNKFFIAIPSFMHLYIARVYKEYPRNRLAFLICSFALFYLKCFLMLQNRWEPFLQAAFHQKTGFRIANYFTFLHLLKKSANYQQLFIRGR